MQGHIHKRVHTTKSGKQTTRWYIVVDVGTDASGRRRQKWHGGFRTRREAEVARAKLVDDLHTGSYVMPDRLTFGDWIRNSWLPMTETRVKPSTFHSYRRNLEIHVLPVIGSRPMQQLTPLMLNALYAKLQCEGSGNGVLSAKTVRTSIRRSTRRSSTPSMPACSLRTSPSGRSRRDRPASPRARSDRGSRRSWRGS